LAQCDGTRRANGDIPHLDLEQSARMLRAATAFVCAWVLLLATTLLIGPTTGVANAPMSASMEPERGSTASPIRQSFHPRTTAFGASRYVSLVFASFGPTPQHEEEKDRVDDVDNPEPDRRDGTGDFAFVPRRPSMEEVCAVMQHSAANHDLPLPFFARLIWQESRFRSDAVSRTGARGIAQFMPGTAGMRGLSNPHDPIEALKKSADFLSELREQFGNIGLAAAAYNGGPGRVQAWLRGRKSLPRETKQYVRIVTGVPAEEWRAGENVAAVQTSRIPAQVPCPALVAMASAYDGTSADSAPERTEASVRTSAAMSEASRWFVVLASNHSKSRAHAQAERVQQQFHSVLNGREPVVISGRVPGRGRMTVVRIAEQNRATADQLCTQLRANGTSCLVVRTSEAGTGPSS
jgi:hypothetical protein